MIDIIAIFSRCGNAFKTNDIQLYRFCHSLVSSLCSVSVPFLCLLLPCKDHVKTVRIDGSTDRCCIAIVTNERALLSWSDQPVRNLGRRRILRLSGGKTNSQRPPHLHNGIWCTVNIGNGYELNNNKGKTD